MNTNNFMTEYQRMCTSYEGCRDCPLRTDSGQCTEIPSRFTKEFIDKVAKTVEDWSAAHSRKTRQSVFLEQWPEAELDTNGAVAICPTILSSEYRSANKRCKHPGTACSDCRREFWMQEVE